MNAAQFEQHLAAEGFSPPVIGRYPPGCFNAPHAHPFEVRGLVLSGQMTITPIGGTAVCYQPGEVFSMPLRGRHSEQVGAEACAYLYGMRSPD